MVSMFLGKVKYVLLLFLVLITAGAQADILFYNNPVPFHFGLHPPGSGNQTLTQDLCVYYDSTAVNKYNVNVTTAAGSFVMDGIIHGQQLPFTIRWENKKLTYGVDQKFNKPASWSDCNGGEKNAKIRLRVRGNDINSAAADLYQTDLIIQLTEVP